MQTNIVPRYRISNEVFFYSLVNIVHDCTLKKIDSLAVFMCNAILYSASIAVTGDFEPNVFTYQSDFAVQHTWRQKCLCSHEE